MEDFFRFGVGIEKKNFRKSLETECQSRVESRVEFKVESQFFGYFTEFTGASARKVSS